MRVLIVKLTSMGDLIHALPALTDAKRAIPDIEFDWVVDESFVEVPLFHPSVKRTIKTAHRRWSRAKWQAINSGELRQFWRELRQEKYDIVLDAQNNLKSAIVTRLCRGLRCGMDKGSGREYGAHLAYQKTFTMPPLKESHAILRQRQLFAAALGYPLPQTEPDFGVDTAKLPSLGFTLPEPYLVFVHNTTWDSKHWPERYWEQLIKLATGAGYHVVLPWGSKHELARAQRLAATAANATTVVPYLGIGEKATLLFNARGVIAVDTGLAHLTSVLNKPGIHLYGPTDVNLLGVPSAKQKYLSAAYHCAPCYLHDCKFGDESECFVKELPPEKVWASFVEHLGVVG